MDPARRMETRLTAPLVAACIAPAALALWFVSRFSVDVPYWDEWENVKLLRASYEGRISLPALVAQHNEHRILVPRLLMLGLDRLSRSDNRWEMYASWCCLAGLALLVFAAIRRAWPEHALLAALPMSAMVFTLRQWENLLWGMQLTLMCCVLFTAASFTLLLSPRKLAVVAALVCAAAASFSFFNGLVVWPAGAVQIVAARRWRLLPAWCLSGAATVALYLHGYVKPANHPSLTYVLHQPLAGLSYFLAAAGNAMSAREGTALFYGSLIALLAIWMLFSSLRNGHDATIAPGLTAFAAGTWAALTIGRAGFGVEQALTSRYATFTVLGVCGIYLYALQARQFAVAGLLVLLILPAAITNASLELRSGPARLADRQRDRDTLLSFEFAPEESMSLLYLEPVSELARFLRDRRLSVFGRPQPVPDFQLDSVAGVTMPATIRITPGNATVTVSGWAVDRASKQPLLAVKVALDGAELPALYGLARPAAALLVHEAAAARSGFQASLPVEALSPGMHRLKILVTNRAGAGYAEPEQSFTVEAH